MKKVDVPEPAKTLIEKTHGLLDKYLQKALPKGEQWAVGGGTMLAARWRHRLSNDLGILLHEDSNLRKLEGDRGRAMQADFRTTGAIEFDWDSDVCRTTLYETSKIDIIVGRATPAEGKETADFGTGTAAILSNAQILSGKLKNRALNPPVRDLFDIAVADEADPESLRIAADGLQGEDAADASTNPEAIGIEQESESAGHPHEGVTVAPGRDSAASASTT